MVEPIAPDRTSSPLLRSPEAQLSFVEGSGASALSHEYCPALDDPFGCHNGPNHRAIRKLLIAIALCCIFMTAEVVGGYLAGSLAIITDAAHLLSDVAGFLVSLFAITWSRKRASAAMSYGYHRAEILGALLSISLVWAMTFYLLVEAVDRLRNPVPVDGKIMSVVALLGVFVNAIIGLVLHEGHHHGGTATATTAMGAGAGCHSHDGSPITIQAEFIGESDVRVLPDSRNINVRAAFIHAVGDLIQSVGVLVAAVVIWVKPEWQIADPLCTLFFSVLVVASTWFLVRDTIYILMEGTPKDISPRDLQEELAAIEGVMEVHDLHVWSLAPGKASATVHIVIDWTRQAADPFYYESVLLRCQKAICKKNVHHVTIQVDPSRQLDVHCRVDCCGSRENFLSNTPVQI